MTEDEKDQETREILYAIDAQEERISDADAALCDLEAEGVYEGSEYDEWECELENARHELSVLRDELRIIKNMS